MPHSPFADISVPTDSIYDYLLGSLTDEDLAKAAVVDGLTGAVTTFGELRGQVNAFASALQKRGVGPGDVLGLLATNIPIFVAVFHGILRAGATVSTINVLYTEADIAFQLRNSGSSWLVTISALLVQAETAAEEAGIPKEQIIVLDGAVGYQSAADLLADAGEVVVHEFDPATTVAVLPYSSGTTGHPKGVRLSHTNLTVNVAQIFALLGLRDDDRILAQLPVFHIYGITMLLNLALLRRVPIVTVPRFEVESYLTIIQEHQPTYVFIAPPIAVILAKNPAVDQYDLSSIRTIFSGAAPLDGELARAVAARLGVEVLQGYGMTELSPASHLIPRGSGIAPDTVGVAVPNTEFRIVDTETGEELVASEDGPSAPGELWVRGPQVMLGYLNNEQATRETVDADGFLHTGDIAVSYSSGSIKLVDRLKELIKYHGYQIAPAELEALLLTSPDIADAAVIGVPDDEGQEYPKAFVVRAVGSTITAQGVIDFVAERVAPHKKVRQVQFIDVIPKSGSGKVLRKELREQEAASREDQHR